MSILATAIGTGLGALFTWLMNRKKGKNDSYQYPKGTNVQGDTITFPDGSTITKVQLSEIEKQFEKQAPELLGQLKDTLKEPEKYPEYADILNQAIHVFDVEKEIRGEIPELKQLPESYKMPPADELKELNFEPIAAGARKAFQEETLPGIAERFTSMTGGGQRSGAFERQKAQAGATLESNLAALRAQVEPEYALKRAEYGLQRGKLGGILSQLDINRQQMANQQALQRAQLYGNLGLGMQQNVLAGARTRLAYEQAARQPEQYRQGMLQRLLSGGVASPYEIAQQGPQPTLWQTVAPYAGDAFGKAAGAFAKYGAKTLFK